MKQVVSNVGPYYSIRACCEELGIESQTAVRYRMMKHRVPTKRVGYQVFVHLDKLRAAFEAEKVVQ